MQITKKSSSESETESVGEYIGSRLRGGEVIELRSDIGGGKTVFTRGLVRGAGSSDNVNSPTFTITKEYLVPDNDKLKRIVHADMYRLQDPGVMSYELADVHDAQSVLVVEWADIVENVLPPERMIVEIETLADGTRKLLLQTPGRMDYLVQEFA